MINRRILLGSQGRKRIGMKNKKRHGGADKRRKSSHEVAEAYLVRLEDAHGAGSLSTPENILTPVALDESSRYLVSLEDDGIPCIPLIGESHFRRRYRNAQLHMHPGCYEFTLCLRGNIEYVCRGKTYRFHPGDIFAVGPGIPHRTSSFPKGLRRYRLLFKMETGSSGILGFSEEETKWMIRSIRSIGVRRFSDTGEVRRGFQRVMQIIGEMPPDSPERRIKLKVVIAELLLSIISLANQPLQIHPANKVDMVIEEMRSHPEREYSIDDILSRVHMSASSFSHKFKHATGLPPHAFLAECRMHRAKELLSNDVSVSATAHRCGFVSTKHFSTVFRNFTGMAPSKWAGDAVSPFQPGS